MDAEINIDEKNSVSSENKLWRPKITLKSHFDTVRSIAFHPNDLTLLSASDDGTVKMWPLDSFTTLKKYNIFNYRIPVDVEPLFTFRGHIGPVMSLAISTLLPPNADAILEERLQHGLLASAGFDSTIRIWGLPDKSSSPYSLYGTEIDYE